MRIVGLQDFAMAAQAWLDESTSVSWLRAFERLAAEGGHEAHAVLREHTHDYYAMEQPTRGVGYVFTKAHGKRLAEAVCRLRPDVVMYNCCYYARLPELMAVVRQQLPSAVQVVRTHHEVRRVLPRPLLAAVLANADHVIVSTDADWEYVVGSGGLPSSHSVIPFGVDVPYYCCQAHAAQQAGGLDFAASCSGNPVKNLPLLKAVFAELAGRGYSTCNILGQPKAQYARLLQSARVYFSTSTSEASGSRSLLEAYACGAYPVVAAECVSACEVVGKLGRGQVVDTASASAAAIADRLEAVLASLPPARSSPAAQQLTDYGEEQEVRALVSAIQGQAARAC
ncbi:hypothetical protein COO60DRAFT_1643862 [Scenedesmus sp. NREL 46B-D3]|nr:hypothetical protein COO60DRAFT_1643862 [Scenedesmus sp. NREL 46B-D3]